MNPLNLVALCNGCNIRVNKERSYWTRYFQGILSMEVSIPKEEVNRENKCPKKNQ